MKNRDLGENFLFTKLIYQFLSKYNYFINYYYLSNCKLPYKLLFSHIFFKSE